MLCLMQRGGQFPRDISLGQEFEVFEQDYLGDSNQCSGVSVSSEVTRREWTCGCVLLVALYCYSIVGTRQIR